MRSQGPVVAIDGPSGAGKSTAGRALAERLGYNYIDTGAMYRALALKAMRSGVSLDSEEALATLCRAASIELSNGGRSVFLDGEDVSAAIRSPETSRASSLVSVHPGVRTEMVARQREMGREGRVVLDGRDIGTAVFPDAEVKFFLDASPSERTQRRLEELRASGSDITLETVEADVRERDYTDTHRAESPLVRAWDALELDTTRLSPEEVLERMLAAVRAREGKPIDLGRLAEEHRRSSRQYIEALRSAALSVGLYRLPAGSEDEQRPHGEEEVYLVLEGKGRFKMGDEDVVAAPGHLLSVPARVEHRFHSIEEDLLLLVFFAPAEGSAEKEQLD
ncbi:MAG: (d)CMP kinase [Vicinamibacteria bacterium]